MVTREKRREERKPNNEIPTKHMASHPIGINLSRSIEHIEKKESHNGGGEQRRKNPSIKPRVTCGLECTKKRRSETRLAWDLKFDWIKIRWIIRVINFKLNAIKMRPFYYALWLHRGSSQIPNQFWHRLITLSHTSLFCSHFFFAALVASLAHFDFNDGISGKVSS